MGQVFLARDLAFDDRLVALKLLLPDFLDATGDFMREFVLQRKLSHPAIPRVYDFGFGKHADGEVPYFVMDYVEGVSLARAMRQLHSLSQAWPWMLEMLRALDHLHGLGFLHRDLKPGNVLVRLDGTSSGPQTCLIDYGIAIQLEATPEELFIGTPEYSAPELMAGDPFDVRQDLYAVGLLFYELIEGQRPWPQEDPTALWEVRTYGSYAPISNPECPPALVALVGDLLQPDPERRPASAAEVISRFAEAVGMDPVIETEEAFRHRLDSLRFTGQRGFNAAAREWHAGLRADWGEGKYRPAILVLDDPPGYIGRDLLGELTDRGAVGGARVVRLQLERRTYGPIEAIEPALKVFRRLRQKRRGRGAALPVLKGMAGAATMLTRLHGATVLSVEGLQRADRETLILLAAVFTGAANTRLRVVATVDPHERPAAPDALAALLDGTLAHRITIQALSLDTITRFVDEAVGAGVVPSGRIETMHLRCEGRHARLKALLAEEYRRGNLKRTLGGYHAIMADSGPLGPQEKDASLESLVACIQHPFPEAVIATYLGPYEATLAYLLADGVLERRSDGSVAPGKAIDLRRPYDRLPPRQRRRHHARLAHAVLSIDRFPGQSSLAARELLLTDEPIVATPHLVAAANAAADLMDGGAAQRSIDRARALLATYAAQTEPAQVWRFGVLIARTSARLARLVGDTAAWGRSAGTLFQLGVEEGHIPTIRDGLEAALDVAVHGRDWPAALRHAESRRALPAMDPRSRTHEITGDALFDWVVASRQWHRGEATAALDTLGRALSDGFSEVTPRTQLRLLALRAEVLTAATWLESAPAALQAYRRAAIQQGSGRDAALAQLWHAEVERSRHRSDVALAMIKSVSRDVGSARYRGISAQVELGLAGAHTDFMWLPTALDHIDRARGLADRDGSARISLLARVQEAVLVALVGHADEAVDLIDDVHDDLYSAADQMLLDEVELGRLTVALASDRGARPARLIHAASRLATDAMGRGVRHIALRALSLAARAAISSRRPEEADVLIAQALALVDGWGDVGIPRHELLFIRARAWHHLRRPDADACLAEARVALEEAAAALRDSTRRRDWLDRPASMRISVGDLADSGPLSRRVPLARTRGLERPRVAK